MRQKWEIKDYACSTSYRFKNHPEETLLGLTRAFRHGMEEHNTKRQGRAAVDAGRWDESLRLGTDRFNRRMNVALDHVPVLVKGNASRCQMHDWLKRSIFRWRARSIFRSI